MKDQEYIVRVHHEDDDSLWAEVLDLPGCFASGSNLDELQDALGEAISLYLTDEPDAGKVKGMEELPPDPPAPRKMEVGEMRVKVPA